MALSVGTTIGFYEIASPIGTGGMGEVYRAYDTRLKREVALKLIRRALVDQPDAIERFLREAAALSSLNHPNIVTIYETGVVGADHYIAMELVHGTTVRELARERMPIERTCAIVQQAAEALALAHASHIVHRDIKPENLMVRPDGYVKILDFGLARAADRSGQPTGTILTATSAPGVVLGTIGYLAPEQLMGDPLTPASDVFALGVVLYELLVGRHPFAAPSSVAALHAMLADVPEPPSILNPEVPPALDALVLDALRKDPRLRPTAAEIASRLTGHDAPRPTLVLAQAPAVPSPSAIVGRESELDALLQEFEKARTGAGSVVAISAEAGVGKTTLVETFLAALAHRGESVRIGRGRCSERLSGSEAYLPVLELLDSLQHDSSLGSLSRLTRAIAPTWYAQIAPAAIDIDEAASATDGTPGSQERLKRELGTLLEEAARQHPLILYFDDVQWADPSTTDLLSYLARRIQALPVLIIVTARPSELSQNRHPFLSLKLDLIARGLCRELWPGLLDRPDVARYLSLQFPGHAFPAAFSDIVHERTDGHPLFMADTLGDLRLRGVVRQQDGVWSLAASVTELQRTLPESVRSLVQRKMDALDADDRQLLRAASVQGVAFDTAILSAALSLPDEEVELRLERLEREHALVRFVDEWEYPDRTLTLRYRFVHHVYHKAFKESLRITRRVALSRAVGRVLADRLGERASENAAALALLFETAREGVRAAGYFAVAAGAAARLHAHDEARQLAERGLAAIANEPPAAGSDLGARIVAELDLQMILGLAVKTSRSYADPAVGAAYARARELSRTLDDPARVVPVLMGLAAHYVTAGSIAASRDVGVEMLGLFERLGNPHLNMIGEWFMGAALFHLGELRDAHRHSSRGIELYEPAFHSARVWETGLEPGIFCRAELSRIECVLGDADRALATVDRAVADARALNHPQTLAFALLFDGIIHYERREWPLMWQAMDEALRLCEAKGIAQEALWAAPFAAVALFELGDTEAGVARMEAALAAIARTPSQLLKPFNLITYADMLRRIGRLDRAESSLLDAEQLAARTGQHAYDAELHRIRGELRLTQGRSDEAQAAFREAIAVAERQGALWFEQRAAASLTRTLEHAPAVR